MALIKPLTPEYPLSTNDIYFLIGKMDADKSFWIWHHIMITERLFNKPYYSKIIFCSTSGKLDRAAEVLSKNAKTLSNTSRKNIYFHTFNVISKENSSTMLW